MTHYFENLYCTPLPLDHYKYRYGLIQNDGRRGCVETVLEAAGDQAGRLDDNDVMSDLQLLRLTS